MFTTIRRHQKILWGIIATLTIVSFVIFGPTNARIGNALRGQGAGNLGTIAGRPVTEEQLREASIEADIYYFLSKSRWPSKDPDAARSGFDERREALIQLFRISKIKEFGIQVSDQAVAERASQLLGRYPIDAFETEILKPEGLTLGDFERFLRHDLANQQLAALVGLGGGLVTPQQAEELYRTEHEQISTTAAFFPVSNYLASVSVTPDAVAAFFIKQEDNYYIPRRMQVDYVKVDATNYLADAAAQITNLDAQVEEEYRRLGTNSAIFGKTPEEAKASIKSGAVLNKALLSARKVANAFAGILFDLDPKPPGAFQAVARTNGLVVHTTAPFTQADGPAEPGLPAAFARAAFALTTNDPFSSAVVSSNAVYVLAYNREIAGETPPLTNVQERVTADYRFSEALQAARKAGEAFAQSLSNGVPAGKTFAALAAAAKAKADVLPPFSISTESLPDEVLNHVSLDLLKQKATATAAGKATAFIPTEEGGFVLYVSGVSPVDEAQLKKDLPVYLNSLRTARENEAFGAWFNQQAMQDTGLMQTLNGLNEQRMQSRGAPPRKPKA